MLVNLNGAGGQLQQGQGAGHHVGGREFQIAHVLHYFI